MVTGRSRGAVHSFYELSAHLVSSIAAPASFGALPLIGHSHLPSHLYLFISTDTHMVHVGNASWLAGWLAILCNIIPSPLIFVHGDPGWTPMLDGLMADACYLDSGVIEQVSKKRSLGRPSTRWGDDSRFLYQRASSRQINVSWGPGHL